MVDLAIPTDHVRHVLFAEHTHSRAPGVKRYMKDGAATGLWWAKMAQHVIIFSLSPDSAGRVFHKNCG